MTLKQITIHVVCIILLSLTTTACAVTKGATLKHVENDHIDATHSRAQLVLASDKLLRNVVITNVRFGTVGQFARTELGLQNVSSRNLNLEYKIDWQDAQGFSVNAHAVWQRLSLAPKQIQNIQSVGKTPEAYQIVVNVRLPKDLL